MFRWLTKFYAWACHRLYNELAWCYDAVSWLVSGGRWSTWRRCVLDYLPAGDNAGQAPLRVLEIGFGTGELLIELAQRGVAVHGLELSPAMHQVAANKLRQLGLDPPRVQGRTQVMPFADARFDAIVSTFPADYIVDLATLHECARLLERREATKGRYSSRLIIVGLWVAIEPQWLGRLVPLFYHAPPPQWLTWMERQLTVAGFTAEFTTYRDGMNHISVIIAYKL